MRTSLFAFGAVSLAASLAIASPASATTTVVVGSCSNLTDGVASSCKFNGNINEQTNTTVAGSYLNAQSAYNTYAPTQGWPADLTLTPLAEFLGSGSGGGITFNVNSPTSGTFTVGSGVDLDYYAIKAGNSFVLYEFTGGAGTYDWSTAGLTNSQGDLQDLSHVIFFGTMGGVPEPATWAMMLLGLGMIGASARRRQRNRGRAIALS